MIPDKFKHLLQCHRTFSHSAGDYTRWMAGLTNTG